MKEMKKKIAVRKAGEVRLTARAAYCYCCCCCGVLDSVVAA